MAKKTKKPAKTSAAATKKTQLTRKWWFAYHELYSKINDIGVWMQSMQDDMERVRKITLEMECLAKKNESESAPKPKK